MPAVPRTAQQQHTRGGTERLSCQLAGRQAAGWAGVVASALGWQRCPAPAPAVPAADHGSAVPVPPTLAQVLSCAHSEAAEGRCKCGSAGCTAGGSHFRLPAPAPRRHAGQPPTWLPGKTQFATEVCSAAKAGRRRACSCLWPLAHAQRWDQHRGRRRHHHWQQRPARKV